MTIEDSIWPKSIFHLQIPSYLCLTTYRTTSNSSLITVHKGQWRGALMLSWIRAWINDWVNNRKAGDLRCYRAHYDVIVMIIKILKLELILYCWHQSVIQSNYLLVCKPLGLWIAKLPSRLTFIHFISQFRQLRGINVSSYLMLQHFGPCKGCW